MALQIYEQKDFTGGLNLRSDQFQLADNESPEIMNMEVDPRGGVFSRGGMVRFNSVNVSGTWSPQKLTQFSGASQYLMLANSTKAMRYVSASNTFTALQYSGSDIVCDGTHGACFAPWGSQLYIATGVGGSSTHTYRWDGTTVTQLGGIVINADWKTAGKFPRAQHVVSHANKMFAANVYVEGTAHPDRIYFSYESDPEKWDSADYFELKNGGSGITGMAVVSGMLLVFKPYATYLVLGYDNTDFSIVEVSTTVGCSSHHAIAQTDSAVYFYATHKGLHYFDGTNLRNLFEPLQPAFDLNYVNSGASEAISVSWIGRRVWVSLPYSTSGSAATVPTLNVVFDPSMGSYTMFKTADNKGVVGGCDFRDGSGNEYGLMCHPTVPCVLSVDNYNVPHDAINVDGSFDGFETVYRTKWFDGGSFMQRKMFRRPDFVLRETSTVQALTIDVYHDYQEADGTEARSFVFTQSPTAGGMLWGENWAYEPVGQAVYGSVWSNEVLGGSIATAKNLGLCKAVQLRLSGELKKPWGINSIGYKWMPRRVKG